MRAELETAVPVHFQARAPIAPLAGFVELLWYWSGDARNYGRERLLPMGQVELVIQVRNSRPYAAISGPRSEPFIIDRREAQAIIGVHFKAGGAFPFLRCAFGEVHNIGVTLDQLWGAKRAQRLLEILYESPTIEGKFGILEQWLMSIADRPLKHHPSVSLAIKEFQSDPGLFTSERIARETNLSQRRFIELFRDEVGLTPKLFCRVRRFQNVIESIANRDQVDWADLALSHGYSDQSHFIHDFRAFSGLKPSEYLSLRTDALNHVRVLD